MRIEAPYYPIIYVRGYAASMNEIEDTVATPYMGFNLGSTKIRQDYESRITPFIFESPLIRLMKDESYIDAYRDGDFIQEPERVPPRSVWIFRYYEPVSEDLGDGTRREIPHFAAELRKFILRIRDQVCGDDENDRRKFKVYLVAHSMGGLICRCYLQNICRNGVRDAYPKLKGAALTRLNKEHELGAQPADPLVDKVFTYATPHNGIDMAGINVPNLGSFDRLHVRNFNRDAMRKYLALSNGGDRVDSLEGTFPTDRFFCFVGTNYRDYGAFFGMSKRGTGAMSDGLVMIRNATVSGAPRAFAHRSHSGHYGIVNSEEGYQNLRRFLFGDVRADVTMLIDEITLPPRLEKAVGDNRQRIKAAYNIEAAAAVRGLNVFVNERRVSQESAIRRPYEQLVHENKPVYLFSGYLSKRAKTEDTGDTALAFAIDIGVQVPVYELDRRFWMNGHFEGGYLFRDKITIHVRPRADGTTFRYGLESSSGPSAAPRMLTPIENENGRIVLEIPIGFAENAAAKPKPGMRGRLRITASPWNGD
ncbi:lipase family alpha/beta hydrolase [Thioalkalivibrio paradoxus]|uniref:DUF676 domain-containing protein n=1 Tax=Thioalkalivibrio paradoxus ARh 1 TaxID=713585 RepID=W0DI17_9GAMM|nr:hypothetical protein [Thioalkalivibrio paradoxus]AHE98259.1 hypothetical protein THITH_08275 [Thioalkalivibrio paradoxus ARh 1]